MNFDAMEKILDEDVTFYTDKLNETEVYVEYPLENGASCFEPVGSKKFHAFLGCRYRDLTEERTRPNYSELLAIKTEEAVYYQDNPVAIHRRLTGKLSKKIVYFLADRQRRCVVITKDGWRIRQNSNIKFLRSSTDLPQVDPKSGGDYLKLMLPKLNMDYDDALLYSVFLVQAFSRSSSHFAAIISASAGCGKSTLTKQTGSLIHPSQLTAALTPSNESNLIVMLANTYIASFDNASQLSESYSNVLCAAITGSKEAKRELYSDCNQVVLNLHNLVIMNGINIIPKKSDLADRSLYFEMKSIPSTSRRTDDDINREFERDKPYILGAIFDTLAAAMRILPMLKVDDLLRMADAHKEMLAIAIALGIEQAEFERILAANKKKLLAAYTDSNTFVAVIKEYMVGKGAVCLPAETLYKEIAKCAQAANVPFSNSASAFSRKLKEERNILLAAGYEFSPAGSDGNNNYIELRRIGSKQRVSVPSAKKKKH